MSKNIEQVFVANPITSNASTDLMYFGQSPYGVGNDAAMTYANFALQFGAPYTAAALTSSNDTNVTITLGGSPTTALLHAASLTLGWTGTLAVTRGGLGVSTTPTNGQIPIGNGINYTASTITAGTNIGVTNGSGSITINATGAAAFTYNSVSTNTQLLAVNNGYITQNGVTQVVYTLPTTAAQGSVIQIVGFSTGGWTIHQTSGQNIFLGNVSTTIGAGGSLSSTNLNDQITLVCVIADTIWMTTASVGNITVV